MNTKKVFLPQYHDLLRPEIASLIPQTAKRILDLGCGSGKLGEHIKRKQDCHYEGIEINPLAVAMAQKRLDSIYLNDIENTKILTSATRYDTLIFADILEHLKEPWDTLRHYINYLTDNGIVIASIPNIAHPAILNDLKKGLFRYVTAGILDRTHLRFFTLTSITQMFAELDLKIVHISPSPSVDNPIQWLIVAKKAKSYGKQTSTSIIIPTVNNRALLQTTIESIRSWTGASYKTIVVNNGSTDDTSQWLLEQDDILEIRNQENLGFVTATNLALEISTTPYVIIGNDDILVSDGWLNGLIECAKSDEKIGIVGPTSNYVSGPQRDPQASYKNEQELQTYASKIRRSGKGVYIPFPRIVFFCTLIKQEVIQKIGLLDEIFSPGNFEDDDYCIRASKAGFKCMIDHSVFIHHYGSMSWKKDPQKYRALMERNKKILLQKWAISESKGFSLSS